MGNEHLSKKFCPLFIAFAFYNSDKHGTSHYDNTPVKKAHKLLHMLLSWKFLYKSAFDLHIKTLLKK